MTIEQFIEELQKIQDKSKAVMVRGESSDMGLVADIAIYTDRIELYSFED